VRISRLVSLLAPVVPIVLAGAVFVWQFGLRGAILATDFRSYYTSGRMVLAGVRSDFYSPAVQFAWQHAWVPEMQAPAELNPFRNPPFLAGLFAGLAWAPVELAFVVWFALNVGLLCVLIAQTQSALSDRGARARRRALVLSVSFLPVIVTLLLGQVSLLLVIGMLGAWQAFRARRDGLAGLALALLLIKPQFLLLHALLLVMHRRWRALLTLIAAGTALLAVSFALVGWEGLLSYWQLISGTLNWQDSFAISPQRMHTWRGFLQLLARTDDPAAVQAPWLIGCLLATVAVLYAWRGHWRPDTARFSVQWAVLCVAVLFVSPYANFHDLSLLIGAGVLLARTASPDLYPRSARWLLAPLPAVGYLSAIATQISESAWHVQLTVVFMGAALGACSWIAGSWYRLATPTSSTAEAGFGSAAQRMQQV
jgi:glycosyl transferase family 87